MRLAITKHPADSMWKMKSQVSLEGLGEFPDQGQLFGGLTSRLHLHNQTFGQRLPLPPPPHQPARRWRGRPAASSLRATGSRGWAAPGISYLHPMHVVPANPEPHQAAFRRRQSPVVPPPSWRSWVWHCCSTWIHRGPPPWQSYTWMPGAKRPPYPEAPNGALPKLVSCLHHCHAPWLGRTSWG